MWYAIDEENVCSLETGQVRPIKGLRRDGILGYCKALPAVLDKYSGAYRWLYRSSQLGVAVVPFTRVEAQFMKYVKIELEVLNNFTPVLDNGCDTVWVGNGVVVNFWGNTVPLLRRLLIEGDLQGAMLWNSGEENGYARMSISPEGELFLSKARMLCRK